MQKTILDQVHDDYEAEVSERLAQMGFLTARAPYHETMGLDMQRRLRRIYRLTSIHLRTRADRVAVHLTAPCVFEFEIKTNRNPVARNLALEALPLMIHTALARLFGINCLYVYRDFVSEREFGFWAGEHPPAGKLFVTGRGDVIFRQTVKTRGLELLQPRSTITGFEGNGTDDSFVVIPEHELLALPHWQELVSAKLADALSATEEGAE